MSACGDRRAQDVGLDEAEPRCRRPRRRARSRPWSIGLSASSVGRRRRDVTTQPTAPSAPMASDGRRATPRARKSDAARAALLRRRRRCRRGGTCGGQAHASEAFARARADSPASVPRLPPGARRRRPRAAPQRRRAQVGLAAQRARAARRARRRRASSIALVRRPRRRAPRDVARAPRRGQRGGLVGRRARATADTSSATVGERIESLRSDRRRPGARWGRRCARRLPVRSHV